MGLTELWIIIMVLADLVSVICLISLQYKVSYTNRHHRDTISLKFAQYDTFCVQVLYDIETWSKLCAVYLICCAIIMDCVSFISHSHFNILMTPKCALWQTENTQMRHFIRVYTVCLETCELERNEIFILNLYPMTSWYKQWTIPSLLHQTRRRIN